MVTVILRRSADDSASPDEAAGVVQSLNSSVVHRSGQSMLIDVDNESKVDELRGKLPGWILSLQGAPIQVPDTRLKVRPRN